MDFIELNQDYATLRGNMKNLDSIHIQLGTWIDEQRYDRKLDGYIVETYHPLENGEEEVEIYMPINV
ncbi:hypothetical protein LCM10_03480 [Rossellomorea aquimaris]|uniref:hypothetical protein n=1 Tax=Rossellomorea aquimaris TaxID=189382 RepID=UPI001CD3F582|nr:hypothetical protein [Rossellomorea aquimaris]MCA1054038.1 hypothetical protein [Rossellomorea aquimaris]